MTGPAGAKRRSRRRAGALVWSALALAACSSPAGPDEGATTAALSAPGGAAAPPRLRPVGNLVGLNERQLTDALGAPSFRRTDGPNELVQYRTAECILDVFLYPNPGGDMTAAYVEARNTALAAVDAADCAGKVAGARQR